MKIKNISLDENGNILYLSECLKEDFEEIVGTIPNGCEIETNPIPEDTEIINTFVFKENETEHKQEIINKGWSDYEKTS